jgi:hypothetical protein
MLICSVFTDKDGQFSKLIIQRETGPAYDDVIEIQLTAEQASQIQALQDLSELDN